MITTVCPLLILYLVPHGDFEGGAADLSAAGWQLGGVVTLARDADGGGNQHLRCGCDDPDKPSAALLAGIEVKPRTGYVARYRMRSDGPAHHTFGVLNPGGAFFVCRDAYALGVWNECTLAFRTEEQTEISLYVGRRYGSGAILYDDVSLVADDSVQTGDLSPAPHPFPALTTEEARRGYLLSSQPWMELIYPTYFPTRSELATALTCRLAPGEYEPVTLSVTALRPLTALRVELEGDLQGPGKATWPAAAVQIGVVRTMTRWLNNGYPLKAGQSYERRPMFIVPGVPVYVPARETQRFWLTVHAGETLRPGTYRSRLRVSAEGAEPRSLPLVVEVLPLQLPEPDVTYGMYYRQCCQYPEFRTEEFYRRSMADMRAHGCNSVSVYANIERRLPDGALAIDFDLTGPGRGIGENHLALNRQMALLQEAGLLHPGHPLLFLATGTSNGEFGNRDRTVATARQLGLEKGWPELLWYVVDEPSAEQRELIQAQADVVHRVPGARTTTAIGEPGELGRYYDVWILGDGLSAMADIVAQARAAGKEGWVYNCQWNGCQPRNDRYFAGYFTWTTGLSGNWQWCYSEATGARLTSEGQVDFGDVTYYEDPHRNCYVLPGPEGNLPTLGWEGRREGVDDYRYLQALRDAIRSAEEGADRTRRRLAQEAHRVLEGIERQTRRPVQHYPATQTGRIYDHVVHPGLQPAQYDRIRARVADYACRLQAR
ncbi:MAG: hypothetical protein HYU66_24165 [Armatimonadetes bacterium]|nr:hypothetical protein [Armatimonadota bacterium]